MIITFFVICVISHWFISTLDFFHMKVVSFTLWPRSTLWKFDFDWKATRDVQNSWQFLHMLSVFGITYRFLYWPENLHFDISITCTNWRAFYQRCLTSLQWSANIAFRRCSFGRIVSFLWKLMPIQKWVCGTSSGGIIFWKILCGIFSI